MDKGTIIILDRNEDPKDFVECYEALLVVRISGEILKDRMGIFYPGQQLTPKNDE